MTHQNQFLQSELKLLPAPKQTEVEAVMADQPLGAYLRLIMKPILVALALLMASEFTDVIPYFHPVIITSLFIYLGLGASGRSFSIVASGIAGGLAGGALGLGYAFFRFIVHLKFPMFFQLVTDPIMLAALGACVAGSVGWFISEGRVRIRQAVYKK